MLFCETISALSPLLTHGRFVMLGTQPVIFSTFENLPDPRVDGGNKRHSLVEIVIVTLCATICGAESWTDVERFGEKKIEWFKKFLKLENGIPSHDTIGRVFAALDTAAFNVCLQDWIEHLQLELRGQGVHIDGKTVRHSFDAATNRKALHLVSAWADGLSICLGQVATDEKSNEITAVPMLLELLEIRGAVITLDAMNCQRKTVAKIRDKQADYVITVKKNQGKRASVLGVWRGELPESPMSLASHNSQDTRAYRRANRDRCSGTASPERIGPLG